MVRKISLIVLFVVLVILAPNARAATGGACPSDAQYLQASTQATVTLSTLGITSCFYIAANGSDSNTGTDEAHPWLHSPGMPNCANNCAITPTAGNGFIFRGGDTWHMGNSSATPYTGGTWSMRSSGTSSNPIYYGVDQAWYSGSSWARPIINGDNPLSTTTVASCNYPAGSSMINLTGTYRIVDNFEVMGMCQGPGTGANNVFSVGSSNHDVLENIYIHGWTLIPFSCGTQCFNLYLIHGNNTSLQSQYTHIVIDGSDSYPAGAAADVYGIENVDHSVFRHVAQFVGICLNDHDNLVEYIVEPGDNHAHGNTWECIANSTNPAMIYNNVFRHEGTSRSGIGVNLWPNPNVGATLYAFNNVLYDIYAASNYWNIGENGGIARGTQIIFNNTMQNPQGIAMLFCNTASTHPFTANSNMYITNGSSQYSSPCTGGTFITDTLRMSESTATANGYTAANNYAPTSANSPSAGAGTNNQSYCSALPEPARTACQHDTTLGVTYDAVNHIAGGPARAVVARPTSGNWDVGAYQYSSATSSAPQPPTSLTATVN